MPSIRILGQDHMVSRGLSWGLTPRIQNAIDTTDLVDPYCLWYTFITSLAPFQNIQTHKECKLKHVRRGASVRCTCREMGIK